MYSNSVKYVIDRYLMCNFIQVQTRFSVYFFGVQKFHLFVMWGCHNPIYCEPICVLALVVTINNTYNHILLDKLHLYLHK